MRKPDEMRWIATDKSICERFKFRCAIKEFVLVLITEGIRVSPHGSGQRGWRDSEPKLLLADILNLSIHRLPLALADGRYDFLRGLVATCQFCEGVRETRPDAVASVTADQACRVASGEVT